MSTSWLSLFEHLRNLGWLAPRAPSRRFACASWLTLIAVFAAVGCGDDKKDGGLAVVIESDLSMPKDIDRLRFEISQDGVTLRTGDHLLGEGKLLMPAEFRLKPVDNSNPVLIRALGFKAGTPRIERSVITTIPSDFFAMVRLPLTYLCAGTARLDGSSTCGDGQTCKLGICETAALDAATLPVYQTGPWSNAESNKRDPSANDCFDVLNCFSQATRVTLDRETCTFPITTDDDPANISVGIKLPQGSDGICGAGACWIALDEGPDGWTHEGTIFKLPPALCRDSSDGSRLVIVASNMCGGKTLTTPACGPWSSATHPADTSESIGKTESDVLETPGDPIGESCAGLSYQPCGDCGQQRRICRNGMWGEWGECLGQGVCTPAASENCGSDGMRVCLSTCDWGDCTGQTCAGTAVEACGNCGTRRRMCTNGAWAEWGECENVGQCAPGTTQGCGVDGTQACMGNCQWGVCGMEVCGGAPSQACGNCGTQSRTCDAATMQWSAFGACGQEGMCEANQTRVCGLRGMQTCGGNCQWDAACAGQVCEGPASQPCGMCGLQTRTCDTNTGVWSGWSACTNEGTCMPGSTQACGAGGTQTCLASCMWNEECAGQVCVGPMTLSCGFCGTESRECDGTTAMWLPFSMCMNQGPCNPGSTRRCGSGGTQTCTASCLWPTVCTGQSCTGESSQPCGDCGTQTRTCDGATGQWSEWGACIGQGPCTPGEPESCGALKNRTCLDTCQFGQCACDPGATACGDLCVNLQTDSAHCGTCTNNCQGRPCVGGVCDVCEGGFHNCGGTCRANNDVNFCGTQDNEDCDRCVPTGALTGSIVNCPGGVCGWTCPSGTIVCGSACVPNNTTSNCGDCGNVCATGESCEGGNCTCPRGGRVGDTANCGGCGVVCPDPANGSPTCNGRTTCGITCDSGFHDCGGTCASNTDPNRCGASCIQCPGPNAACVNGQCQSSCDTGQHECNNECVDNDDIANCGTTSCSACPDPANGSPTCNGTSCGITCDSGFHNCGGTCASNTDPNRCGASCIQCPGPNAACVNGQCQSSCDTGQHECNNECVDNDDITNCGTTSCSACPDPDNGSPTCDGTSCGITCDSGFHNCSGSCASNTDPNRCGASCMQCAGPNAACVNGQCQSSCDSGQHECNNECVDNDDVDNCGTTSCSACPDPDNGSPTCNGTSCGITCDSGFHNCSGSCASNTDPNRCGTSCMQCAGPNAACVNGQCQSSCDSGQHVCSNECVDNDDVANCGTSSCSACPDPDNGSASCDGTSCGIMCDGGFHACGDDTCASNSDVNRCTSSCTQCPDRTGATADCNNNVCVYACNSGTCGDNCETCGAGESCVGGQCQPDAPPAGGQNGGAGESSGEGGGLSSGTGGNGGAGESGAGGDGESGAGAGGDGESGAGAGGDGESGAGAGGDGESGAGAGGDGESGPMADGTGLSADGLSVVD